MKKCHAAVLIFGLCFSLPSLSATTPSGSRYDGRNQTIAYNPADTAVINTAPGFMSVLVFGENETVTDARTGFEPGWDVQMSENRVFIKLRPVTQTVEETDEDGEPQQKQMVFDPENDLDSFRTNLFVVTTKRNYSAELNARSFKDAGKIAFVVNYRYPADEKQERDQAEQKRVAELARKKEIKAINQSFANARVPRNWKYYQRVAENSDSVKPDYAYDDGRFTYFGFNPAKKIPSIFIQTGGQELITNPAKERHGNYTVMVVHQTGERWVLRSGSQVVGVENKGYGLIRVNDTDTVSPDISLEVKKDE